MSRKTKKQKIAAQKRRLLQMQRSINQQSQHHPSIPHQPLPQSKENIDIKADLPTTVKDEGARVVKKDLIKTMIIITILFVIELVVFVIKNNS